MKDSILCLISLRKQKRILHFPIGKLSSPHHPLPWLNIRGPPPTSSLPAVRQCPVCSARPNPPAHCPLLPHRLVTCSLRVSSPACYISTNSVLPSACKHAEALPLKTQKHLDSISPFTCCPFFCLLFSKVPFSASSSSRSVEQPQGIEVLSKLPVIST